MILDNMDKYRVRELIGRGAMGSVYKAFDPQIERDVAIKVLHPHLLDGDMKESFIQRFCQEAKAAARCLHPNIVTIFDFGIYEETPYIVMELVQGIELRAWLKKTKHLTLNQSIEILLQILSALDFSHNQGVIHRDIKPANIILIQNKQIKVSDFGVARLDSSELTHTGYMIGTPNYMSPEGLQGITVDARSDLYSVAVLLFECLTLNKPQKGLNLVESLSLLENTLLTDQEKQALYPILEKALQTNPDDRFQSANLFAEKLRKLLLSQVSMSQVSMSQVSLSQPAKMLELPTENPENSNRPLIANKQLSKLENKNHLNTSSHFINPHVLATIENTLARFIGPTARFLVKKNNLVSQDVISFTQSLVQHIQDEQEQQEFLKQLETSGIYARQPNALQSDTSPIKYGLNDLQTGVNHEPQQSISEQEINQLIQSLTYYVGPLAGRLVKKNIQPHMDINSLYIAMARYIPDESERKDFLKKK